MQPGHLFGIGGILDDLLYVKSGSFYGDLEKKEIFQQQDIITGMEDLSYEDLNFPYDAFKPLYLASSALTPPLLKVSIEPAKLSNLSYLQRALFLLYRNDPSVDLEFLDSGEYILAACGELHLEQLLKDLKEKWIPFISGKSQGFQVTVSAPIVPYRETISDCLAPSVSLRETYCRDLMNLQVFGSKGEDIPGRIVVVERCLDPGTGDWIFLELDLGAKRTLEHSIGEFFLISYIEESFNYLYVHMSIELSSSLRHTLESGFQLAMKKGPLCGEPLYGTTFTIYSLKAFRRPISDYQKDESDVEEGEESTKVYCSVPNSGALISILKDAFHRAFLEWSPRLMLAYNSVEVHTPSKIPLILVF